MSREAKCKCSVCDGPVSFDAEHVDSIIECPHCGMDTVLYEVAPPPFKHRRQWRRIPWAKVLWISLGVLVLSSVIVFFVFAPLELSMSVLAMVSSLVALLIIVAGGAVLYFLPSIIGHHKRNSAAIFVLNLFAGWTFVGWVVALVWACTVESEKKSA